MTCSPTQPIDRPNTNRATPGFNHYKEGKKDKNIPYPALRLRTPSFRDNKSTVSTGYAGHTENDLVEQKTYCCVCGRFGLEWSPLEEAAASP